MRIVAVSDLHGYLPAIPRCDLLIVAGDLCLDVIPENRARSGRPRGMVSAQHDPAAQMAWFNRTFRPWFAAQPARQKLMIWGNHDFCGELPFTIEKALNVLAARGVVERVVSEDPRCRPIILVDEAVDLDGVKVYGTPWSNQFFHWAFMKEPSQLAAVYAQIPEGLDILVSHQPPFGYGDQFNGSGPHIGSHELLAAITRARPKIVICGHIHGGHGEYEHLGIRIYNVSHVDEGYRPVHAPTVIHL